MTTNAAHIDRTDSDALIERVERDSSCLKALVKAASRGGVVTVGRGAGSPGLFVAAHLVRELGRSVVVLTASLDGADRARRDASHFLGAPAYEFPPWESLFEADSEPDPDTFRQRHEVLERLDADGASLIVAPVQAVLQPVSRTKEKKNRRILLRVEEVFPPGELARALVEAGYRRFPQVARPGDFSIRGGIVDVFPREAMQPYRIEFFDDEVESIRIFDPQSQRSQDPVDALVLTLLNRSDYFIRGFTGKEITLLDRLPKDAILAVVDPREVTERCDSLIGQWSPTRVKQISGEFWARGAHATRVDLDPLVPEPGRKPITLPVQGVERFQGTLDNVIDALEKEHERNVGTHIYFPQLAEAERFGEILSDAEVGESVTAALGDLTTGFRWREGETEALLLSGSELLGRLRTLERRKEQSTKSIPSRAVDSFLDLKEGDTVVHVVHGIAKYLGVRTVDEGKRHGEHLVLEYREGVQLLVPAERIDLVQKYVGGGKAAPVLDKVGGTAWSKRKAKVAESVEDLAVEMLEIQALRAERQGYQCPADDHFQEEFEAAFPFDETADQLTAMEAIKSDLESTKPMDRLVCGDVGYGKTELAMRAAFKTVRSGKQVAVVVPTTILAQQHFVTFRERMAEFPVRIEVLSRLKSRREQTEVLAKARAGEVDILIGTHRLFSSDVSFADIGLVVIDEEQKFGVAHKERLKQLRRLVDVLTLTATPIPRTLHLSLLGVKDISSLNEAPRGRAPVKTEVCAFDPPRFREIFLRELNRDGQLFFLHNRVKSIKARRQELERIVPEARMVEVHGQMDEHELARRMNEFIEKRIDVLVSTTIIESGLDIPSANTLIVERADRFGLAEMHQLRGRVGRGQHQAYSYFLIPDDRPLSKDSLARLQAIEEYSQLGAGFDIAMRDLEIRGAGNILGKEQSGHIAVVGYDLYCRLLQRAIERIQGTPSLEPPDVELLTGESCQLPKEYISDETQRLRVYRSVATALDEAAVDEIGEALRDRYGALPDAAERLLLQQRLRIRLAKWGVNRAWLESGWLLVNGVNPDVRSRLESQGWETRLTPDGPLALQPEAAHVESLADLAAAIGESA